MFNTDFSKTYSIRFKAYTKSYDATLIYIKSTNTLKISFLGYYYIIKSMQHNQNECPICKDKYYKLGNSGWDCGNNNCVLGAINLDGSLTTWQDRWNVDSILNIVKDYYKQNSIEIEKKEPTIVEREIEKIEYRKIREVEHANYLSELNKKYGTTDIHSEYHWSNYGDYKVVESKSGSKMDMNRRYE